MSDDRTAQSSWSEYSRLVLKELETLSTGIDNLRVEIQEIKQELAMQQAKEDKVDELRTWKDRIDDIASPTQIKQIVSDVDELKAFKTKAITAFVVVQAAMGFIVWASKFFST
jgi:hypothetical protein